MSQVNTTCSRCGFVFQWLMGEGSQMPDCPQCGFNPIRQQQDSEVDQLLSDLQSPDENKRNNAAVFLGQRGEKRAAEPLLRILKNEGANVPPGVLMALGDLREERAVEMILNLMPDSSLDPNAHMLGWGARALSKIGSEKALEGILSALTYLSDQELKETMDACVALGGNGVPLLLEGLRLWKGNFPDHVRVRCEVIRALGKTKDERVTEPLKALVDAKSSKVAKAARNALKTLERS